MNDPTPLPRELLLRLSAEAAASARLRTTHCLHAPTDRVQRMLLALQPGTYVRPHRHPRPPGRDGFELLCVVQGALGVMAFEDDGRIHSLHHLRAGGAHWGIELPARTFHSVVVLEPDTVALEVKEGPYEPRGEKEFLAGFPEEGAPEASRIVAGWLARFSPGAVRSPPGSG
ncbi:WbuC family cupin fold metalloprotein [Pyxidicoccus parkwayensis]|uniref:WbuC family cupin fold metalloprotein n=1 Tax=Pyxidicoccus parkwayensis TaxID=2813578 RepID=A0ABX7NZI2_9BACT|nr:WbuC family cupin fold metalloprotein [Pyxidicoccus parkwaysis]QSQ24341.1 WbuC family cupin fold metalloprotein [Pyxidicoccus parkwaysis]